MKPGELQKYFIDNLDGYYDEREIRNMFFQVLEHYFNIDRIHFFNENNYNYSTADLQKIRRLIQQLKTYKPIQYIFGSTEFCGLKFSVSPGVLIPRPETEEMVDLILQRIASTDKKEINILDIATGSGCIGISLAVLAGRSRVWACDIHQPALKIAKKNAAHHKVDITIFKLDILKDELPDTIPALDFIASNPPYIRLSEMNQMKPNVLQYEPHEALFVPDSDPLLFYKVIATKALSRLKPGGRLFFEINEAYGNEMVHLLESLNYSEVSLWNDIHGKDRFIEAVR